MSERYTSTGACIDCQVMKVPTRVRAAVNVWQPYALQVPVGLTKQHHDLLQAAVAQCVKDLVTKWQLAWYGNPEADNAPKD
jgi:hypothetical protein